MHTTNLIEHIDTKEAQSFLTEHLQSDPLKLLFKYGQHPLKKALATQLQLRKKLIKKLPEWCHYQNIIFPNTVSTEQASSEATAKLKASLIDGHHLLDLTGGMGVDTYYLSHSFKKTTYVERQQDLYNLSRHNFKVLKAHTISPICGDALEVFKNSDADFIYADPARRDYSNQKLIALEDYQPNLIPHLNTLVNKRKMLIKTSPLLDIHKAIADLKYVSEVWIISHKNECKEVLYLLNSKQNTTPLFRTYNIQNNNIQSFNYKPDNTLSIPLASSIKKYIYEPNTSILKAHGSDKLALSFNLEKLHPNTNFFVSDKLHLEYPGRVMKTIEVLKPYDKSLKGKRFNIVSRNYPDKAHIIEKKLRIKPAKNDFLLACMFGKAQYKFIITKQIITDN